MVFLERKTGITGVPFGRTEVSIPLFRSFFSRSIAQARSRGPWGSRDAWNVWFSCFYLLLYKMYENGWPTWLDFGILGWKWYQMIGLGRRSVPRGILAKKSQNFNEKTFFSPGPLRNFSIFSLRLGPPAKEIWNIVPQFDTTVSWLPKLAALSFGALPVRRSLSAIRIHRIIDLPIYTPSSVNKKS